MMRISRWCVDGESMTMMGHSLEESKGVWDTFQFDGECPGQRVQTILVMACLDRLYYEIRACMSFGYGGTQRQDFVRRWDRPGGPDDSIRR